MTDGIADVSDSTLERLREGLLADRIRAPMTRADLVAFGITHQLDPLVETLCGHSKNACVALLNAVLAERAKFDRPAPELVWTGPEAATGAARDTAVVLRELFEGAQHRVVLAGYSFQNATHVLRPLHKVMGEGVTATFFVDVKQVQQTMHDPVGYGRSELEKFLAENWPFGPPFPRVYCDRRALEPGPPWSSLHAKCVTVDGLRAFVSSANFTNRGQERNIEAGVLMYDRTFAEHLERQLTGLITADLVLGRRDV